MGEVHRAFDTTRKRLVALKRLPAQLAADPAFQVRFRTEPEIAARLRSAHVIPIHDYGEIDGQLFIDMRLVDGEDLAAQLYGPGTLRAAVRRGNKPFPTESLAAALNNHLHAPPPRPSRLRAGISLAFDAVIAPGMAKDPRQRFESAGSLAAAARAALQAPVHPIGDPRWQSQPGPGKSSASAPFHAGRVESGPSSPAAGRSRRSHRLWSIGLATIPVLTLSSTALLLLRGGHTDPPGPGGPTGSPRTVRVVENLAINATTGVAIDPTGTRFYLTVPTKDSQHEVQIRNTSDNSLVGNVPLPDQAVGGLALAPVGNRLFVAGSPASRSAVAVRASRSRPMGGGWWSPAAPASRSSTQGATRSPRLSGCVTTRQGSPSPRTGAAR